jgi:hypothetical protein
MLSRLVAMLVAMPELWNHYASAIFTSKEQQGAVRVCPYGPGQNGFMVDR